mgnify:CR=1 FL=1
MHRFFLTTFLIASAWLGLVQPGRAQGTIAYYRPDTPIPLFTSGFAQYYSLDMDGDVTPELTFSYSFQFLGVRYEAHNRVLSEMLPFPSQSGVPQPLPAGFPLGATSDSGDLRWFAGIPGADYDTDFYGLAICVSSGCGGNFLGQHAYMGVEFERGGAVHYGWVLLNVASHYPSGTIEAWAWETRPGVPICAGAVPEPSTWALLVGGGVLMVWFRRKRNERRG